MVSIVLKFKRSPAQHLEPSQYKKNYLKIFPMKTDTTSFNYNTLMNDKTIKNSLNSTFNKPQEIKRNVESHSIEYPNPITFCKQ